MFEVHGDVQMHKMCCNGWRGERGFCKHVKSRMMFEAFILHVQKENHSGINIRYLNGTSNDRI